MVGDVVWNTPEIIELVDDSSDDEIVWLKVKDDRWWQRHKAVTKRLHRSRKTPCESKFIMYDELHFT